MAYGRGQASNSLITKTGFLIIMIEFRDVTKKFGDNTLVLDKVNFVIPKGSFNFLVGPTGAGKTTIFRLIIKDIAPSEGVILIGDADITRLPKRDIPHLRRKVGVIFQDLKLLMDRTVLENVLLPLQFTTMSEKETNDRAMQALTEMKLDTMHDKFPLQLSGGERQRVAIARALVLSPEVLLADEPTGNLDYEISLEIIALLENINKAGTTIFMATHNEKIIEKHKQKVMHIKNGKIEGSEESVKAEN